MLEVESQLRAWPPAVKRFQNCLALRFATSDSIEGVTVSQSVARLSKFFRRFWRDSHGNTAMIFGLSLFPILAATGFAIDYGRGTDMKAKLGSVADQAALSAVSVASNRYLTSPSLTQAQQMFASAVANMPGVTITSLTETPVTSVTSLTVTINYTATMQTNFGGLIGVKTINFSGSATASRNYPFYVNFYLALDNSPSMGVAATPSDISHMQAVTPDSCAFACHQHTFDASGNITGDDMNDYYHIAKANNITTRIDVLRSATQQLTQTAQSSEIVPNQYQMGIYTFSDTLQIVANPSPVLSQVATAAQKIDLAYAYKDQRDTQTSFDTLLTYANNSLPTAGTGLTAASPQEVLFMVTDGVQDAPVGSASGNGDQQDPPSSYQPSGNLPNLASNKSGNVSGTRLISALDPTLCTAIKNKNIKIAILYTTYLPITNNSFYNSWVAPLSSSISDNLKSCATPDLFFEVSPTQGISTAMQQLFFKALSVARLTQ